MSRKKYLTSNFKYNKPFYFETDFDEEPRLQWMADNWSVSILLSVMYVLLIFGIQKFMQNRPKYNLRTAMSIWSGALSVFSICASIRSVPEVYHAVVHHGWEFSVCSPSCYYGQTAIWAYLIAISKAYELGDTLFIVLRKQPLIFLHWYHHVTVMIYSWYTYGHFYAPGRWFATINTVVHAFMYTYYFLKAVRIKLPMWINVTLTFMQTSQMVFGLIVNFHAFTVLQRGDSCHVTYDNIKYSLLMYTSYFILFSHYFYTTYIGTSRHKLMKSATQDIAVNGFHSSSVHQKST